MQQKTFFFFDVETNGKILDMKAPVDRVEFYPRITQLCFESWREDANGDTVCLQKFNEFIKPNGWTIPKEQFFIDNNMSTERCEELGIPIEMALHQFIQERTAADYTIAHNITFDSRVIRTEMIRAKNVVDFASKKICTMNASTNFCALPHASGRGGYKWPKLEELHMKLFGTKFEDAHDASGDVGAMVKCFFELKRKGVIVL